MVRTWNQLNGSFFATPPLCTAAALFVTWIYPVPLGRQNITSKITLRCNMSLFKHNVTKTVHIKASRDTDIIDSKWKMCFIHLFVEIVMWHWFWISDNVGKLDFASLAMKIKNVEGVKCFYGLLFHWRFSNQHVTCHLIFV